MLIPKYTANTYCDKGFERHSFYINHTLSHTLTHTHTHSLTHTHTHTHQTSEAELRKIIHEADIEKDGMIHYDEFVALMSATPTRARDSVFSPRASATTGALPVVKEAEDEVGLHALTPSVTAD